MGGLVQDDSRSNRLDTSWTGGREDNNAGRVAHYSLPDPNLESKSPPNPSTAEALSDDCSVEITGDRGTSNSVKVEVTTALNPFTLEGWGQCTRLPRLICLPQFLDPLDNILDWVDQDDPGLTTGSSEAILRSCQRTMRLYEELFAPGGIFEGQRRDDRAGLSGERGPLSTEIPSVNRAAPIPTDPGLQVTLPQETLAGQGAIQQNTTQPGGRRRAPSSSTGRNRKGGIHAAAVAALLLAQGLSSSPTVAAGGSQTAAASQRSGGGGKAKSGAVPPQVIGGKRNCRHLTFPDDIQTVTDGLTNPPLLSAQKNSPKRSKSTVLPPPPPPSLPSHSKSLSQTLTNSLGTPPPNRCVAASAAAMVPPHLIPIVRKAPGQPPAESREAAAVGCGSLSTLGKRSWESVAAAALSASAGGRPFLTFPHLTAPRQSESVFLTPPRRQSPGQTLPEFGHDTQPRLGSNTNNSTEPTALSLVGLPPPGARTKAPTRQQMDEGPPEGMLMDAFVRDRGFLTSSAIPQTVEPPVSLSPPLH
uniref:Uncharacterized protein n=1 Tax=Chromera velia CCMP2878 TaxID=1169474 RepID=A0A0G4GFD8_9ALVE|eukprot:Cvel_21650.t1-p1 / transcript=Cvel_21650.t1 / gene=Cvel_21650 / organism=Chromera_velia_CCMP2878 / gene_product=hypothetical protein / transcript_product=hypothetical protein / location=Cvel_scaffold2047:25134-30072(+) / protein_length=529 / sequence_SO=supercontig / SO=protein_coding / is_pseudo=false